jgi:transaldolase
MDGRVSIEVDPRIAHDTDLTIAEARALWWLVDRPNLFVKIPPRKHGLPAITACLAEGISINIMLIFSLVRYAEVIEAFLADMEQARAARRDLSGIASVASFFVSRVDTEVDKRLDKLGTKQAAALRGKAAIANARLAYQHCEQAIATERWKSLETAGARPQRPLWASTSVKDPAYDDARYVTGLVAPRDQHHARSHAQRGLRSRCRSRTTASAAPISSRRPSSTTGRPAQRAPTRIVAVPPLPSAPQGTCRLWV